MKLEQVLEVAKECVANDKIPLEGLKIVYQLEEEIHKQLDQELFYKINNNISSFEHNEVIELNIGGITFVFEIL